MTQGQISKMRTERGSDGLVQYRLPVGDTEIPLNPRIGTELRLKYLGEIHCIACGRKTSKSFSQGYCFPCMRSLARCDMCIVRPEKCHYDQGTCREPAWGEEHCMIPHAVYLANSSGLKVGITRAHQQQTRWMDQGAVAAIPLATVKRRLDAGLVEVALKSFVADKTNWRTMLKGEIAEIDLVAERARLAAHLPQAISWQLSTADPVNFEFPVEAYPQKIKSFNLDKNPEAGGLLQGIKGQYLIFADGVINMRKYTGYQLEVS
jgi:hypothetical protein